MAVVGQQPIARLRRGPLWADPARSVQSQRRYLVQTRDAIFGLSSSSERHRQKNSSHSLFISKFRPCETRQRVFEFPGCMRLEQSVAGPVNRTPMKSEPLTDRISRVQVKCPAYRSVADIHWEQVRCRQYVELSRNYHARRAVLIWADAGRYSWGRANTTIAPVPTIFPITPFAPLHQNVDGGLGGGQIGYKRQVDRRWVIGLEADIQGTGERSSALLTTVGPDYGAFDNGLPNNAGPDFNPIATFRGRADILSRSANPALCDWRSGGRRIQI
jgi:hypothetical protein